MPPQADPLHAAAARVLSAGVFAPLAALSYPLYLFHMTALHCLAALCPLLLGGSLPELARASPVPALAVLCAACAAASYALAALWLLLERRGRGLLRRRWGLDA